MLIERGRADEAKTNLGRIEGMVTRMAEIAKTLKGFTRKSGTDIKPVSLRQVIDEATLLLQPQIKQKQVTLELDLSRGGHHRQGRTHPAGAGGHQPPVQCRWTPSAIGPLSDREPGPSRATAKKRS